MAAYIVKRVLQIVLTLFVFLTIVFFLVNAQPGDISRLYSLDPNLPPETRAQMQELFGVNEPAVEAVPGASEEHADGGPGRVLQPLSKDRG